MVVTITPVEILLVVGGFFTLCYLTFVFVRTDKVSSTAIRMFCAFVLVAIGIIKLSVDMAVDKSAGDAIIMIFIWISLLIMDAIKLGSEY